MFCAGMLNDTEILVSKLWQISTPFQGVKPRKSSITTSKKYFAHHYHTKTLTFEVPGHDVTNHDILETLVGHVHGNPKLYMPEAEYVKL